MSNTLKTSNLIDYIQNFTGLFLHRKQDSVEITGQEHDNKAMSIRIEKPLILPEALISRMNRLFEECNSHDNTGYVFDSNEEFMNKGDRNNFLLFKDNKLVSAVTLFAPGRKEAEIIACTLPEYRKRGYFRMLLHEAETELQRRKIPSLLLVCDNRSGSGKAVAEKMKASHEYSEFLLRYREEDKTRFSVNPEIRLKGSETADKARLTEINREAFHESLEEAAAMIDGFYSSSRRKLLSIFFRNTLAGMIGIYLEPGRAYIHGFCIHKDFRGRGIGRQALAETVEICRNTWPDKTVVLEVHAENESALGLYTSAGFNSIAEFRYYRLY